MAVALEKYTGKPIGQIYESVARNRFYLSDLNAIILHGLIGAGMDHRAAFDLVESYIATRSVMQNWQLAFDILELLWSGEIVTDDVAEASEPEAA
ncbi:hypothetical protein BA060_02625 [Brucella sp. B13-0095]|nr:hypothetical protein BA060_02625 [Brucella sp. B13-0095]